MKTKTLLLFVLIGLMTSCQQNKPTDNPENLKQVDGIKNMDLNKMNDVTTSDFILYEDGKVWNNDSLMDFLNTFPKFTADYTFDNFKIDVDNVSGNMYYFNHCDFTLNDTTKLTFNWIESATFKKIDGRWKMNFLHSTVRK